MSQARRSYEDNLQLMEYLLQKLVVKHKFFTEKDDVDWGNVGDLDHVNEHLMTILKLNPADIAERLGMDFS